MGAGYLSVSYSLMLEGDGDSEISKKVYLKFSRKAPKTGVGKQGKETFVDSGDR